MSSNSHCLNRSPYKLHPLESLDKGDKTTKAKQVSHDLQPFSLLIGVFWASGGRERSSSTGHGSAVVPLASRHFRVPLRACWGRCRGIRPARYVPFRDGAPWGTLEKLPPHPQLASSSVPKLLHRLCLSSPGRRLSSGSPLWSLVFVVCWLVCTMF